MLAENHCAEAPSRERSFGKLSRCRALKLVGAAILGATLVPLFSKRALAPAQSGYNWWGVSDVQYVPGSTLRMCQITGNYDPEGLTHINCTGQWGIEGTDLSVPVEHQGKLFIFFGDVPSANDADPIVCTIDLDPEPRGCLATATPRWDACAPVVAARRTVCPARVARSPRAPLCAAPRRS